MNNRTIAITVDNDSILSLNIAYTYLSAKLDMISKRTLEVRAEQARRKAAAAPKPLANILSLACPSSSRPGLYHTLTIDRHSKLSCSCEGFAFREACRHTESYRRSGRYYDTVMTAIFRTVED